MDSPKDQAKADKKASKAKLKAEKKGGGMADPASAARGGSEGSPSPAERSAAAAEKQVGLQRYRVLFAMLMFLVAMATLLWTVKPWRYLPEAVLPVAAPEATATHPP